MNKEIIIQKILTKTGAKTYLEIGFSIDAPYKMAIDPKFRIGFRRNLRNVNGWFVRRKPRRSRLQYSEQEIQKLTYGELKNNRMISGTLSVTS